METQNQNIKENKSKQFNVNNMLLAFIVVIVVIAAIALVGIFFLKPKPVPIVGQVEVDEIRVSGKVPGRIAQFFVEEGQMVKAGDTVVRIFTPEVDAKLVQAKGAQMSADAMKAKADDGTRSEIKQQAFEMWQKAKAGLKIAEQSFNRIKRLYEKEVVPAQKYDEVKAQYEAMVATEKAAHSQYQMALNGAQWQDKQAAAGLAEKAGGAIKEVDAYLKEGHLVSPIDGLVSEIFPHAGELVGSGAPIMNIYDPSKKKVIFTMREDLLGDIRIGSIIKGKVPAVENKEYSFRVTKIHDMGTYAAWKASKPSEQIDLRTLEIIAVPVQNENVTNLLPGMSVVLEGRYQ
ncbi:MAG: HlyD family efflux transporter periplasmic adaptor subunit [Porphyromonadaceae bacterium]|nr:HlyD family efflux transporter periplasmic adaptor subunit [Porphyromonadaceae bacterium]